MVDEESQEIAASRTRARRATTTNRRNDMVIEGEASRVEDEAVASEPEAVKITPEPEAEAPRLSRRPKAGRREHTRFAASTGQ